ncbi:hypothetical protein CGU37_27885, partial [Pseudomonas fluorescens]
MQSFEKHAFEYSHVRVAGIQSDLQGMSVALEQVVRALGVQGTQLSKMFRDLWNGTEVGRILKKQKTLLERGLPLGDLLEDIATLRANGGEHEKAADLILATRVRGIDPCVAEARRCRLRLNCPAPHPLAIHDR